MTTADLARALKYLHGLRPFLHYEIGFTSGERVTITHPEVVTQFGDLFVYAGSDRSYRIFSGDCVGDLHIPPPG